MSEHYLYFRGAVYRVDGCGSDNGHLRARMLFTLSDRYSTRVAYPFDAISTKNNRVFCEIKSKCSDNGASVSPVTIFLVWPPTMKIVAHRYEMG